MNIWLLIKFVRFGSHTICQSLKKICSRWIPTYFVNFVAQNKARVDWSKEMLHKYNSGASKHVYDIVIGDESGIYACEPESKQQSSVWVFQDEPNPTKVARARSFCKQMIACFSEILDMSQSYH